MIFPVKLMELTCTHRGFVNNCCNFFL